MSWQEDVGSSIAQLLDRAGNTAIDVYAQRELSTYSGSVQAPTVPMRTGQAQPSPFEGGMAWLPWLALAAGAVLLVRYLKH